MSKGEKLLFFVADMISQLFVLYRSPSVSTRPSPILQAEIDPREVFMRAALK